MSPNHASPGLTPSSTTQRGAYRQAPPKMFVVGPGPLPFGMATPPRHPSLATRSKTFSPMGPQPGVVRTRSIH
eukprot:CAMPEP_0175830258 /NCGR_PEP_ID=MMETSP0107_2-20121207/13826_1 /TAXON_ID=195067 ORGANISM="Goniomonas pacifica, Strain CCMP1869" /NCGR_SAMPLE_ID=MMETSP0107_2 /ASSEMBLY_ACC=CAM_ASM_000203 /LENGTH=72 /DNA_ID=CAMNT_0017143199 /DNA_START=55 /DNA_END=273 /DNA_ORIENTATION=+